MCQLRLGLVIAASLSVGAMPAVAAAPPVAQEAVSGHVTVESDTYTVRRWSADTGLLSNRVNGLAQTPDGYLWIATSGGLMRFDGQRFVQVEPPAEGEAGGLQVKDIVVDSTGTLWAEFDYLSNFLKRVLARRVGGGWEVVHRYDGSGDQKLAASPDGAVWFQSGGGGVGRWLEGELTTFDVPNVNTTGGIIATASGDVWASTVPTSADRRAGRAAVVRVDGDGDGVTRVDLPAVPGLRAATAFHEDDDGRIWVGTSAGLMVGTADGFVPFETPGEGPVNEILPAGTDHFWISRGRSALARVARAGVLPGREPGPPDAISLWTGIAISSLVDTEGNYWFGLRSEGLVQLRKDPLEVTADSASEPINPNYMTLGYPRTNESVWVTEDCRVRILRRDGSRVTLTEGFPPPPVPPDETGRFTRPVSPHHPDCVHAIAQGGDGALWYLRARNGVTRLEDGALTTYPYSALAPVGTPTFLSWPRKLTANASGDFWFVGSGEAIVRLRLDGTQTVYPIEGEPDVAPIEVLRPGAGDDVWFGAEVGFGRLSDGEMTRWNSREWLSGARVTDVYVDARGGAWISSRGGGLLYVEGESVSRLTGADGLHDDYIFRVLETDDGNLWLLSAKGVMVMPREHAIDYIRGGVDVLDVGLLDRGDGAPEFQTAFSAGVKGLDGRIWLLGRGLVVADPAEIRWNDKGPTVLIEEVTVDGEPARGDDVVVVEPGRRNIEIRYTVPTFDDPDRVRFRYRLDGRDDDWRAPDDRRSATYSDLWPGEYTLRVIARNNLSAWSAPGTTVQIRVLPMWWQTTWFMVAAVVGVMGLGIALQSLRTRWVRRRNAVLQIEIDARTSAEIALTDLSRRMITAQEDDRARIARELHDDVSQRLAAASIGLEMSTGAVDEDPAAAKEQLRALLGQLDQVSEKIRRVSHELHPGVLHNLGLETALEVLCEEFQSHSGVTVRPRFEGPTPELPDDVALCIYRVSQEALHNVAKHAEADAVDLELTTTGEHVRLRIRDDGVGFDAGSPEVGLGLASISERARLLDGTVDVRSAPGNGAEVVVGIPLAPSV